MPNALTIKYSQWESLPALDCDHCLPEKYNNPTLASGEKVSESGIFLCTCINKQHHKNKTALETSGRPTSRCIFGPYSACTINPQTPKVFRQPKTAQGGGWCNPPPGFLPSRPNFLKIFLMGMFSGSRNPTVIMKKFYLYCMTLKIKVKHLFAWPVLSPVVNMIQSWSWCRF